ncbi:hypothetical protein Hdeb2414_s1073g00978361 [Helianthus debilis subsp. tardiflorus]
MASEDEMDGAGDFDPWADDDCSRYPYMIYPSQTYEAKRFNKLREMKVGCMRGIHWDSLETCRVVDTVRQVIGHGNRWYITRIWRPRRFRCLRWLSRMAGMMMLRSRLSMNRGIISIHRELITRLGCLGQPTVFSIGFCVTKMSKCDS